MLLARRNSDWLPDVFNDFFDADFMPRVSATAPAINVIEKDNEYDVELAAPGMTKDDFKVSVDADNNLVVDLEKKTEKKEDNNDDKKEGKKNEGRYLRREFCYTQFHQSLILPDDVETDKISANVNNGVLKVVLPKKTAQEMKKNNKVIEIH